MKRLENNNTVPVPCSPDMHSLRVSVIKDKEHLQNLRIRTYSLNVMYPFFDLKFLSIVGIEFVNNFRYNKEHRSQEFLK